MLFVVFLILFIYTNIAAGKSVVYLGSSARRDATPTADAVAMATQPPADHVTVTSAIANMSTTTGNVRGCF